MIYGPFSSNKDAFEALGTYSIRDIVDEFKACPYDDMRDTWSFESKENPKWYVELSRSGVTANLGYGTMSSDKFSKLKKIGNKFVDTFGDNIDEPTDFRKNYE